MVHGGKYDLAFVVLGLWVLYLVESGYQFLCACLLTGKRERGMASESFIWSVWPRQQAI